MLYWGSSKIINAEKAIGREGLYPCNNNTVIFSYHKIELLRIQFRLAMKALRSSKRIGPEPHSVTGVRLGPDE